MGNFQLTFRVAVGRTDAGRLYAEFRRPDLGTLIAETPTDLRRKIEECAANAGGGYELARLLASVNVVIDIDPTSETIPDPG